VTDLFSKSKNYGVPVQVKPAGSELFRSFWVILFDVNVENRIDKMVGFEAYASGPGVV